MARAGPANFEISATRSSAVIPARQFPLESTGVDLYAGELGSGALPLDWEASQAP
jgi:hypothetical protein